MKSFDIKALKLGLDQYWSALDMDLTFDIVNKQISNSTLGDLYFSDDWINIDGSFEQNGFGWTFWGHSLDTEVFRTTINSSKAIADGTSKDNRGPAISVVSGETYYAEVWVKGQDFSTGTVEIVSVVASPDGSIIQYPSFDAISVSDMQPDIWYKLSFYSVIPANMSSFALLLSVKSDTPNGVFYFDDVRLRRTDAITNMQLLADNKPISAGSNNSILVSEKILRVDDSSTRNNFILSFIFEPKIDDIWLVKFDNQDYDIGVKLSKDGVITLLWLFEGLPIESSLLYKNEISYFNLSYTGNRITLVFNNLRIELPSDVLDIGNFSFGGGEGQFLIDKISYSKDTNHLNYREYMRLFPNANIPLVDINSSYIYFDLASSSKPTIKIFYSEDFIFDTDYKYAIFRNYDVYSVFAITKYAKTLVEFSIDAGETWQELPNFYTIDDYVDEIMFRHNGDENIGVIVEVSMTTEPYFATPNYSLEVDGSIHLAKQVTSNYYFPYPSYIKSTSLKIVDDESKVRTLRLLASFDDTFGALVDSIDFASTTGFVSYINGVQKTLDTIKPHRFYIIDIIFDQDKDFVTINPDKILGCHISGIGVSSQVIASSELTESANIILGNVLIQKESAFNGIEDGISPNGGLTPHAVLDIQWNRT